MQVLDHPNGRTARRVRRREAWAGPGQLIDARRPGFDCCRPTEVDPNRGGQRAGGEIDLLCRESQARQHIRNTAADLVSNHVDRLVQTDAAGPAQNFAQRPVGDAVANGEGATAQDADVRMSFLGMPQELVREPALPDAGRAIHHHQPRPSGLDRLVQQSDERCQFPVATDHGSAQAAHPSTRRWQRRQQWVGASRIGLALQVEHLRFAEAEGAFGCRKRPVADQDREGICRCLQALGDIDGVAGYQSLVSRRTDSGHYFAAVDADPHLQRHLVMLYESGVQLSEALLHLQGGMQSSLSVVLVDERHAKHGHDRVADVLLDGAAPRLDDGSHRREVGAE